MVQVTLQEARRKFDELLDEVGHGEQVLITRDDMPFAVLAAPGLIGDRGDLSAEEITGNAPREPGSAKGIVLYIADDFDAPLDDFKDYM
jgi:antitoxin (DNA-binding transcriptional repressor) of toxin-antitoxin stability system